MVKLLTRTWASIQLWPWKIIGLIGGGIVLIGSLILLAHIINDTIDDARQSGIKQGRSEVQAKWDSEKAGAANARAELSAALTEAFNGLDGTLQHTVRTIARNGQTIRVQVEKDMKDDPRYTAADCSITPGVHDKINAARSLSGPPASTTVRSGGVPTSGAIVRFEFGDAGTR